MFVIFEIKEFIFVSQLMTDLTLSVFQKKQKGIQQTLQLSEF